MSHVFWPGGLVSELVHQDISLCYVFGGSSIQSIRENFFPKARILAAEVTIELTVGQWMLGDAVVDTSQGVTLVTELQGLLQPCGCRGIYIKVAAPGDISVMLDVTTRLSREYLENMFMSSSSFDRKQSFLPSNELCFDSKQPANMSYDG